MGKICRRNSLFFFAGLLALCAVASIAYALSSEEWVSCKITRYLNTTNGTFDAGWKKFGLFKGCEQIKPYNIFGSVRDDCFEGSFNELCGIRCRKGTNKGGLHNRIPIYNSYTGTTL